METVKRGLPLIPDHLGAPAPVVPFWPDLDRRMAEAQDMGDSADLELLSSWKLLYERQSRSGFSAAERSWVKASFRQMSPFWAGVTYLRSLRFTQKEVQMAQAWKSWGAKYRSPEALLEGLNLLEKNRDPQVSGLLRQAIQLYPGDRRFFPLMLLHRPDFPQVDPLIRRDFTQTGGFSGEEVRALIRRLDGSPENRKAVVTLLWETGYRTSDLQLEAFLDGLVDTLPAATGDGDYLLWTKVWQKNPDEVGKADGLYSWDVDGDGESEAWVWLQSGKVVFWSEGYGAGDQGAWLASFIQGQLDKTLERTGSEGWVLRWESYPYLSSVGWESGETRIVYSFEPFVVSQPLFDPGKVRVPQALWPLNLRQPHALPGVTSPEALLPLAVRKDTYKGKLLIQRLSLVHGEVWMAEEDSNEDGRPDTWYFYQQGQLSSVFRNFDPVPQPNLVEMYEEGRLKKVLADPERQGHTEFALFPQVGVELWDWKGAGLPITRVFHWAGGQAQVLVFSKKQPPFMTMPGWPDSTWP